MQLVVGSILAPRLEKFAEREKERLGSADADSLPSPEDDEEEAAMKTHAQRRKPLYKWTLKARKLHVYSVL